MDPVIFVPLIVLLVLSSFLFGAGESAFFSMKTWETKRLTKTTKNRSFINLNANIQNLISTLTLGSTTFNACIIAIAVHYSIKVSIMYFIVLLVIIYIFIALICEIIPKTLAIKSPQKWALALSKPIFIFHLIFKPLSYLAEKISNFSLRILIPKKLIPTPNTSEEDFAELIDWAYQQGVLEKSEREIMEEIIKLDQKIADEIMKPRAQMICIEDNLPIEVMIAEAKKNKYTRLPIFNDTPDNIVGILNTRKLLLNPNDDLAESIEFPSFVPSSMNLMDLLQRLQLQRRGLAIVLDEFGGTAGLITIEDIIEEIVGEMREEGEKIEFTIEKLNRNRWRINGSLAIEDFQKILPELKVIPEVNTMGGLVVALKEVVPHVGGSVISNGLEFTVVAADDRRVKELIVKKLA